MGKALAALGILAGSLSVIADLLHAFNVADFSDAQQGAVGGAIGVLLLILGLYFHPDVPVGPVGSDFPVDK